jgi:hypothetical protein
MHTIYLPFGAYLIFLQFLELKIRSLFTLTALTSTEILTLSHKVIFKSNYNRIIVL